MPSLIRGLFKQFNMKDILGKELQYGDLFIFSDYNTLRYGIYKSTNPWGTTEQFYYLREHFLNKLKWDRGIKIPVPSSLWGHKWGRCYGQGDQIAFIIDDYKRVMSITENQLPSNLQTIYKQFKQIINGNSGSRN